MGKTLCLLLAMMLAGCRTPSPPVKILASTSWTAAYAIAAGASDVGILAPSAMVHPSEYELKLSDLKSIKDADFIIYAGYEVMIDQLVQRIETDKTNLIKIETSYHFDQIAKMILLIAEKLGTETLADNNLHEIKNTFEWAKSKIKEDRLDKIPVLVHFYQQSFANELGLNIVGVFGPNPPEAYEIKNLLSTGAKLVIDNFHNPVGESLQLSGNIQRYCLLNFPGSLDTQSISDVIKRNTELLAGK
jgi:zinc transport system substrate-binding protein